MKKQFFLSTVAFFALSTLFTAYAVELDITGNSNGSNNTVTIDQKNKNTIQQGSTTVIDNTINGSAKTGDNTVSGNTDGDSSIVTGDAIQNTTIRNTTNSNVVVDPKKKPTPTNTPGVVPNPTNPPGSSNGGNGGGGSSNTSSNGQATSTGTGGIGGGGEVLGLPSTSGNAIQTTLTSLIGFVCLVTGSLLVKKV